ncbi:anti-sigma factor [Bacillus sp. FJAT-49731]|uniref:Anti-sigma-W factor RsiW n=1 Tax=Lederbergia citrea TaxID=2833581 RepID=A0A942Z4Q2_9BACI|nr:anti-sigma factor [Lederbergia citrea]MBS4179100.1 anti-sigma factor [Lederbergia citrea]MBS4205760.1 anti-sigma factor [Lederbergia citrea]MBS4223904.1 anti-sigma factor [Lederbergia citrea]
MKACPEEINLYMQEYLDGDLSRENEQVLKEHLQKCPACQNHFQELKRTIAYIKSTSHIQVSNEFTAKVMGNLPKEKSSAGVKRWLRHHPLLAAASLFLILMAGSVFNVWNNDQKFSVTKETNLVVENDTVIVPEGKVVEGDITVKNGNLRIEGEVKGNVTIINGERYMASAGNVTGEIEEINELFEWIWYKMKDSGKKVVNLFEEE